jgi:hypothetical protein
MPARAWLSTQSHEVRPYFNKGERILLLDKDQNLGISAVTTSPITPVAVPARRDMDINVARTFLEVVKTGSFVKAALGSRRRAISSSVSPHHWFRCGTAPAAPRLSRREARRL